MKIYATSDTHFNHAKLIEWGRPQNFQYQILDNLKKVHGDLFIHCGDICIGEDLNSHTLLMNALAGFKKKVLVRGNHDNKSDTWYYNAGWDFVCDSFTSEMFGKKVLFTHAPKVPVIGRYDRNIHGHLHGNNHRAEDLEGELYNPEWHYDLAPDIHDYKPVNLEKLLTH